MINVNIHTNEVVVKILDCLDTGKSLSLVRIGDGEAMCLNKKAQQNRINTFYKRHIGYVPPVKIQKEIRINLIKSINQSDIIGIPTDALLNFKPGWEKCRGLVESCLVDSDKLFCDMNIHWEIYTKKLLEVIIKEVETVYLITPRDVVQLFKNKFPNLKTVIWYNIPGQYLFNKEKVIQNYYPRAYNDTIEKISKLDTRKELMLVGGGFIGKSFCSEFANRGGVAIDVGSIFDNMVGLKTRGEGKGAGVKCESLF